MSTNRFDFFGIVGVSAQTLEAELESILRRCEENESALDELDSPLKADLHKRCGCIATRLQTFKNQLPVTSHSSYIDSWAAACSHAYQIGWPDGRKRMLLPDQVSLIFYPQFNPDDLLDHIKHKGVDHETRVYVSHLHNTIKTIDGYGIPWLIVVCIENLGGSRKDDEICESGRADIFQSS